MTRVGTFGVCGGLLLCGVFAAPPARAQIRLAKSVQLSLDSALVSYTRLSAKDPNGTSSTQSQTELGLFGSPLGAGVSYVLNEHVSLGLRATFRRTSFQPPDGATCCESTLTQFQALPRVQVLLDGDRVRPFLAGMVGVGRIVQHRSALAGAPDTEIAQTHFLFGGSAGVHAFIARNWSIDPMLSALGNSGSVSAARSDSSNKVENDLSGLQIMLSIGLSGWIGAGAQPYRPGFAPPADDDDAEDSAPPTAPLTAPLTAPPGAPPPFTPPESTDQAGSGPITK